MRNHLLYIGIILLLVFLLFDGCNKRVVENKSDDSVSDYLNDTISYKTNKEGLDVATRIAINGNDLALLILLSKQIDTTQQLQRLVKGFKKVDAAGNITQQFDIDSTFVPYNTLSFAIGKTKGLFNSEYRIEVVNSNPKIKTIGLDSYTFKAPKKRIGIGLQVGYGIGSDFTIQPYVGIGISYNFIRF